MDKQFTRFFTFTALLFLVPFALLAQTNCVINGLVKDLETGLPLDNAVVFFDGKKTTITTDSTGKFYFNVSCGEHTVRVSYVGYVPYSNLMEVNGPMNLDIRLQNKTTQLEEVIVTSQGSVRTTETPALGVNLLSMKAVQKMPPAAGEVDILRGMQMLPGVSSVGEGANGINVRGGNVDQNLIYLDNMPIFNPTHMLGLFSLFPTDAIREMDIYKGSMPARYGGRTSAVLDVKMTEPSTDAFKLKGGIGLISNRLNMEIPLIKEKLSLLTSARLSYNEYLIRFYNTAFKSIGAKPIPNNHANFYDLVNKISYKPTEKDNITFSSYLSNDQYSVDSLFEIAGALAKKATINYGHQNFALRWNHYFNTKLNFNLLAVSARYATKTSVADESAALNLNTEILYKNLKAEVTYIPSAKQRINAGISAIRYDIQAGNLIPPAGSIISTVKVQPQQAYELAAFVADEYEISDKILFEAGLRLEQYFNMGAYNVPLYAENVPKSKESVTSTLALGASDVEQSFTRLEPRLALRYKVNDKNSFKLGYNRTNQFLQILGNNTTPLPNARWQLSNRYIAPQQSDLMTIGYFNDSKERFWEYSLELYYRQQKNIVDYTNSADLQINTQIETQLLRGSAKSYGIEFLLSKKKGVMTGWLSYTYSRALQQVLGDFPAKQQLNDGNWFPASIDKPHALNIVTNFQTERHMSVSFTFVYSTGRPFTAPVSFYRVKNDFIPVYTDRNNDRISDYHRLDFAWTILPAVKKQRYNSNWVFTIYNLYGRQNAYSYFFKPNGFGVKPYKLSIFSAPLVSLTYNMTFE
jgi:hypothetical protein